MKKKSLFLSLAVAVVLGLSIFTATILSGCGKKQTINTVNVYSESPRYEVGQLTSHKTVLADAKMNGESPTGKGTVVLTKTTEEKTYYALYNLKSGSFVVDYTECKEMEVVGENDHSTYYAITTTTEEGEEVLRVLDASKNEIFGGEKFEGAGLVNSLVDGKKTYELWYVSADEQEYYEMHEINKKGVRSVLWTTKVDAGQPVWIGGVQVLASNVENLNKEVLNLAASYNLVGNDVVYNVYDLAEMELKHSLVVEGMMADNSVGVDFNGGLMILQTINELPNDAEDYDYYDAESGIKYEVVTKTYDVINGKVKTIKNFEYLLTGNQYDSTSSEDYIIASAQKIENGRLGATISIQINESLKVKELDCDVQSIKKISDDRFLVGYEVALISTSTDEETGEKVSVTTYYTYFKIVDRKFNNICEVSNMMSNVSACYIEPVNGLVVVEYSGEYRIIDADGKLVSDKAYDQYVTYANGKLLMGIDENVNEATRKVYYTVSLNDDGTTNVSELAYVQDGEDYFNGAKVEDFVLEDRVCYTVATAEDGKVTYTIYNLNKEVIGTIVAENATDYQLAVNDNFDSENGCMIAVALLSETDGEIVDCLTWFDSTKYVG